MYVRFFLLWWQYNSNSNRNSHFDFHQCPREPSTHTQTQRRTMHQNRLTSWFGNFGVNEPLSFWICLARTNWISKIFIRPTYSDLSTVVCRDTKTRNTTSQEIDIKRRRRRRWKKGSFQFIALLYRFLAVVYFRLGDLMCQLYPETDNNLCEK